MQIKTNNICFEPQSDLLKKAYEASKRALDRYNEIDNKIKQRASQLRKAYPSCNIDQDEIIRTLDEKAEIASQDYKKIKKEYEQIWIQILNEESKYISDDEILQINCIKHLHKSTKIIDLFLDSYKPFLAISGDFIIDELGYPGCQLLLSNKDILVDGYFNFSQKKNLGFYTFSDLLNSKYRLLRGIQEEVQNCYEQYQEETYVRKFLKSEKWNTYRYSNRKNKGHILFFYHCIPINAQSSTGREDGYGRTDVVLYVYGIIF